MGNSSVLTDMQQIQRSWPWTPQVGTTESYVDTEKAKYSHGSATIDIGSLSYSVHIASWELT
jgi:hypothetical protein